jgi:hypothetical protein
MKDDRKLDARGSFDDGIAWSADVSQLMLPSADKIQYRIRWLLAFKRGWSERRRGG